MIAAQTVFVLGAGASIPYGFPSSSDLLRRALDVDKHAKPAICNAAACSEIELSNFANDLRLSGAYSVDAFLEKHPDRPKLQRIGKVLIAYGLAKSTAATSAGGDWLRFVWNRMNQGAPTFQAAIDRVRFVTFNFDWSVETRLSLAARAMFDLTVEAAVHTTNDHVVHIHGGLPQRPPANEVPADQHADWLGRSADAIQVVHDNSSDDVLRTASDWIDEADVICFLGFGFHEPNLRKIGFRRDAMKAERAKFFGSACGLFPGDLAEAKRLVNPPAVLSLDQRTFGKIDEDALAFLHSYDVLPTR